MASIPLKVRPDMHEIAIGIDLGGTQVRAALVSEQGEVLARAEDRTDAMAGPDRVLAQIKAPPEVRSLSVSASRHRDRSIRSPVLQGISRPSQGLPISL